MGLLCKNKGGINHHVACSYTVVHYIVSTLDCTPKGLESEVCVHTILLKLYEVGQINTYQQIPIGFTVVEDMCTIYFMCRASS